MGLGGVKKIWNVALPAIREVTGFSSSRNSTRPPSNFSSLTRPESPSNKLLQIDSAVLADGTVVLLDLQQANYLNSNGIVTALNFIGGYVLWGDESNAERRSCQCRKGLSPRTRR